MKTYKLTILLIGSLNIMVACNSITKSIRDTFDDSSKAEKDTAASASNLMPDTSKQETVQQRKIYKEVTPPPVKDFLSDTLALGKAEQSLRKLPQYNGKKIRLYDDIHFYDDGRVMLNLQHPENPEYIDAYEYDDGVWSEPKPVQISIRTNLQSKLFDLDRIKFRTVSTIMNNYNEKAATIEGAKPVNHVYGIVWDGEFIWYPRSINGSRQRFAIDFNLDGSVKMFRRE